MYLEKILCLARIAYPSKRSTPKKEPQIQVRPPLSVLYSPRAQEVIIVSFFLYPAALKMLVVATATPALFALQATKIKWSKFHLSYPRGV